ncbi:hypothetical protein Hanom_Chr02g00173881 [Helianthus anomalus]
MVLIYSKMNQSYPKILYVVQMRYYNNSTVPFRNGITTQKTCTITLVQVSNQNPVYYSLSVPE